MRIAVPPLSRGVPLFPLPDAFLFPGVVAPLHIFEPRYRQMVGDLLDGPGRLVIAALQPDAPSTEHGPQTVGVGALVEIVHHEKLADGCYLIWVLSLGRVTMTEVASDRLYRRVDAAALLEAEPDAERAERLQPRLVAALKNRSSNNDLTLSDWGSIGRLADLLVEALKLDADRVAQAFLEPDPAVRADLALTWSGLVDPS